MSLLFEKLTGDTLNPLLRLQARLSNVAFLRRGLRDEIFTAAHRAAKLVVPVGTGGVAEWPMAAVLKTVI